MASTRFSLRAAILFAFIAISEVSGSEHAHKVKKHRKRGRCHPQGPMLSSALPVSSALPISSSTLETSLVISASISESLSTPVSASSPVPSESSSSSIEVSTTSVQASSSALPSSLSSEPLPASSSALPSSSYSSSLPISTSSSAIPSTSERPSSTTASSVIVTSSSPPPCEPTISTWAPELCWHTIPFRCSSMTNTVFQAPTLTSYINGCSSALRVYGNQLAPQIQTAGCFDNISQANFNPASAFNCISSASILCQATSACAPAATSVPVIPAYDNPGFESGSLGSWTEIAPATPGNLVASITDELAHTGSHSLKLIFNNLAADFIGWEHRVRFEPGGQYQFSFWYFSVSNQSRGTLSLKVEWPGFSLPMPVQMSSQGTGRWIQQKFTIAPGASFGTVSFTYLSTLGTAANTIYIDDVTVTKVG